MEKYRLVTDDFVLEMELEVCEADIDLPVNSSLNIKVESDGFAALTSMDYAPPERESVRDQLRRLQAEGKQKPQHRSRDRER